MPSCISNLSTTPWTETEPGFWQRSIGDNERFIHFIGSRAQKIGREHWSISASATFLLNVALSSVELSRQCVEAWCALRFEHPSIACTVEGDMLVYRVPSDQALEAWAHETFTVHGEDIIADDVIAALGPSKYTTGHFFLAERKFVLHAAHWRTDGYGALQLVNSFMDCLCSSIGREKPKLPFGDEGQRLTPSIEDILNLPDIATQEVMDATTECLKTLSYARGAVGVEAKKKGDGGPRGTRSARFRLTEAQTKAVQEASATRGISILSAVHASCAALTYLEASPDDREKHYTSTIRLSLRPNIPEPYCTAAAAAALYTGGYMIRVPSSQSWMENARHYQSQYDTGVTADFLKCRRHYAVEVLRMLQRVPPPVELPPGDIDISSVGDAEALVFPQHVHGKTTLDVTDVSIGVETLTRQIYCFTWTYRGCLELSLVYNEAFYAAGYTQQLVHKLAKILMSELALEG